MYDNIKRMEDIYLQHRQGHKKATTIKKDSSLSSI